MTDPDDLLLSDAERLHALTALGDHYAAGRLDDSEFHARSGDVAAARTLGQLRGSFADLPGGPPLTAVDGVIVHAATAGGAGQPASSSSLSSSLPSSTSVFSSSSSSPAVTDAERELEDLRRRGGTVETLDGLVLGATLVAFLILQFVVAWDYAWIVWPSLALTLGVPRAILKFTDADEELYDELKESEGEARKERLRAATERIRELGDGRENRG